MKPTAINPTAPGVDSVTIEPIAINPTTTAILVESVIEPITVNTTTLTSTSVASEQVQHRQLTSSDNSTVTTTTVSHNNLVRDTHIDPVLVNQATIAHTDPRLAAHILGHWHHIHTLRNTLRVSHPFDETVEVAHTELAEIKYFTNYHMAPDGKCSMMVKWTNGETTCEPIENVHHCTQAFDQLFAWAKAKCVRNGTRIGEPVVVGDRPITPIPPQFLYQRDPYPFCHDEIGGHCLQSALQNILFRFGLGPLPTNTVVVGKTIKDLTWWLHHNTLIRIVRKVSPPVRDLLALTGRHVFLCIVWTKFDTHHAVVVDARHRPTLLLDATNPCAVRLVPETVNWLLRPQRVYIVDHKVPKRI